MLLAWDRQERLGLQDADMSPDGRTFAALLSNDTLVFIDSFGGILRWVSLDWINTYEQVRCPEDATVRFRDDASVIVACKKEAQAVTTDGQVLWSEQVSESRWIRSFAVLPGGDGIMYVAGLREVVMWYLGQGAVSPAENLSGSALAVVGTPDHRTIAIVGGGVRVVSAAGVTLMNAPSNADREEGAALTHRGDFVTILEPHVWGFLDARVVFSPIDTDSMEPEFYNLSNGQLSLKWEQWGTQYVAGSPGGRFFAIETLMEVWHGDYGTFENVFVVLDRMDPLAEHGFRVFENARVFLAEDGTATALSTTGEGLFMTRAVANATLPTTTVTPSSGLGTCP